MKGRSFTTEHVEVEVKIHFETEKALLVSGDGEKDHAVWIAKSLIEVIDEGEKAYAILTIPQYLAEEKELV